MSYYRLTYSTNFYNIKKVAILVYMFIDAFNRKRGAGTLYTVAMP